MHYYQFNIGDYVSHTSRLSPIEDLAYRRILDSYYLNERPFNGCSTDVAREIGLTEYSKEVDYILNKYFENINDSWVQKRVEQEILFYQSKIEAASKAGKASAKAREIKKIEKQSNDRSTTVQQESNDRATNQEPITNNQQTLLKDICNCPYGQIRELYHSILVTKGLSGTVDLDRWTDERKTAIRKVWRSNPKYQDLKWWTRLFGYISTCDFLLGNTESGNWKCNIDWIVKPKNLIKIIEKEYS